MEFAKEVRVMSPILSSVYIDELILRLMMFSLVLYLNYADDLVLLSPTVPTTMSVNSTEWNSM